MKLSPCVTVGFGNDIMMGPDAGLPRATSVAQTGSSKCCLQRVMIVRECEAPLSLEQLNGIHNGRCIYVPAVVVCSLNGPCFSISLTMSLDQ